MIPRQQRKQGKTDAESHNSDVEHDEAVTRKQSYLIGMRGLLSCGEKVVSRITTAIVAYGLCESV